MEQGFAAYVAARVAAEEGRRERIYAKLYARLGYDDDDAIVTVMARKENRDLHVKKQEEEILRQIDGEALTKWKKAGVFPEFVNGNVPVIFPPKPG